MVKPDKRKVPGGRVTPKGGGEAAKARPQPSTRYTPPIPREVKVSPPWVAPVMFVFLGLGLLVIFLNYIGIVLPGATSNWYLVVGLGFILAGILTATKLH